jgi:YD repeat-containing protein
MRRPVPDSSRGSVTSAQHWRNTDNAWLASYNQYDDAGNVIKAIDPRGNPTTFSYADSWGNASCTPAGGNGAAYRTAVTNALSQAAHATYNSCTGTAASSVDLNNQSTTYSYDALGRRLQTTFPLDASNSHPVTSVTYNEKSSVKCYEIKDDYNVT